MKKNFKWLESNIKENEVKVGFDFKGTEFTFDPVAELRGRMREDYVDFSESISPKETFDGLLKREKTQIAKEINKVAEKACNKFNTSGQKDLNILIGLFVLEVKDQK